MRMLARSDGKRAICLPPGTYIPEQYMTPNSRDFDEKGSGCSLEIECLACLFYSLGRRGAPGGLIWTIGNGGLGHGCQLSRITGLVNGGPRRTA